MVSSSPEFSITKPGLHHRKRDKPLRTYGRQTSTPEAQTGPPSKKARISAERERQQQEKSASNLTSANDISNLNDDAAVAGAVEGAAHKQDASAQIKAEKPGESLKRGSILSYFKPASQPVPKADMPSPQLQGSPTEEASSPPQSSPKQQPTKRKPRLLRIKATAHEPSDQSSSSSSQETDENPVPQKRRGRPPLKSNIISNSSDATSSNQDTTTTSSSSPSSPTKQSTTIKPKKNKLFSPAVQTTLNISAQAAFSECKICNTVWNPLYPDDVKYHIKTHKAVLRAEKKRNMDEL